MKYYFLTLVAVLLASSACAQTTWKPRKHPIFINETSNSGGALRAPQRIGDAATAPVKAVGSPNIPVVLVQFSDLAFTKGTTEAYEGFFNTDSVSVARYFSDQSFGTFTPNFTIIGPVTLPKTMAYYGKNSGSTKDVNITVFYSDAIKEAQELQSDWSVFDNDGNGTTDMVFFIYAGNGENEVGVSSDAIWPKESVNTITINGNTYSSYAVCNELYEDQMDGIGAVCHEMGHALGLPDFYDTGYNYFGMDYWDIMANGDFNYDGYLPCGYTAYEREFFGWGKTLQVLDAQKDAGIYTLYPASEIDAEADKGFKIFGDDENDYYILENRQNTGWDEWIGYSNDDIGKNHGMLVTHVRYSSSAWKSNNVNSSSTQRMTILPADGEVYPYFEALNEGTDEAYIHYITSMAGDPYPGIAGVTEIEELDIHDITEQEDGSIRFRLGTIPDAITIIQQTIPQGNETNIYDLSGRKVQQTKQHGVFIQGGKKIWK